MGNQLLRVCELVAVIVLLLSLSWDSARTEDVIPQTRPTTAPATTRAANTIIAEWQFVDGERGYDEPERPVRETVHDRRTLVRIYGDGRVRMSGDLMLGGGEMIEGELSPQELDRLESALAKFIDGMHGKELQFSIMQNFPWHEIKIDLGDGKTTTMLTSMRVIELEHWAHIRSLFSWRKDEMWTPNMQGKENRYEATLVRPVSFLAHRMIWLELEAEILRAATQSMLPDVDPRLPVQRNPSPH